MSALSLIALIVIYLSRFASADSDPFEEFNCKIIENKTPIYALKRHLFCDYDPSIRTGHGGQNSTFIDAMILPRYTKFKTESASMEMNSWFYVDFFDSFLTWNPQEHDGIKSMDIKSSEVWIPDLYSINPSGGNMPAIPDTKCKLSYKGNIVCVASVKYNAACVSDYTYWPWDTHNCTLQIGAWAYRDEEITFSNETGIVIDHYRDTDEWMISLPHIYMRKEKSKLSSNATVPTVTMSVILSRTRTALKSVIVSPVIILTVVTLTILWLRPGSTERLILSCINLLGHVITIRNLHFNVPGNDVPNIMIFYNNSLILSMLALILTCWLQRLLEWKKQVPGWLATPVTIIYTSKVGQVLSINMMDPQGSALLQDDADDNSALVDLKLKQSKWENVVTVIGWLSLFSFGLTYFIMSVVLLC